MAYSLDSAINRIAERSFENRRLWGQSLRQRRTEFTDVYGVQYRSEIESDKDFIYHINISPDLEYYERFQFQLYVQTATDGASIDPDNFRIWMTDARTYDEDEEDYEWIELSEFLMEQLDEWVDGTGYYPAEQTGDGNTMEFYDILDACGMLVAGGDEDDKTMLLDAGTKLIKVHSPTKCDVILNLFLKYSTINR